MSLMLAPALAACGCQKCRCLLDEDWAIPAEPLTNWNPFLASIAHSRPKKWLTPLGAVLRSKTKDCPADGVLYALRDVTWTPSTAFPHHRLHHLKKGRRGTDALVLDVKPGPAAFMKTTEDARTLAPFNGQQPRAWAFAQLHNSRPWANPSAPTSATHLRGCSIHAVMQGKGSADTRGNWSCSKALNCCHGAR